MKRHPQKQPVRNPKSKRGNAPQDIEREELPEHGETLTHAFRNDDGNPMEDDTDNFSIKPHKRF